MAFRHGHVATDVAWRRVKPFERTDAARPGFLTAAEAARLVNASDVDFRLLVRGALETGARFGELAAARIRDFQNGKLHIVKSKFRPRSRCSVVGCRCEVLCIHHRWPPW